MKTIIPRIILIISIFISKDAVAQNDFDVDTCYVYHQFQGEWRYVNGIDTVRFYLKAVRNTSVFGDFNNTRVTDKLIGWHEYKRGNTIIESNYNNRFMTLPSNLYNLPQGAISIWLHLDKNYNSCNSSARRLFGLFKDFGLGGEIVKVYSAIFSGDLQTLVWIQGRNDFSHNPETAVMTLPPHFTLIKQ